MKATPSARFEAAFALQSTRNGRPSNMTTSLWQASTTPSRRRNSAEGSPYRRAVLRNTSTGAPRLQGAGCRAGVGTVPAGSHGNGAAADECSTPAPIQPYSDDPAPSETLGPKDLKTYTPDPRAVELPYFASKINDHSWRSPSACRPHVTLRAFSASGTVLADEDVTLNWIRVGGSERCGGPEEAGPVTLVIAS